LKSLLESLKVINHQVPVKLWQNLSNEEVIHYVMISRNLLILFGMSNNSHSSGMNVFLHLPMKRVMKLTVVIIDEYHSYPLHTKFYPVFFSQG
jgi:hypothetical protein